MKKLIKKDPIISVIVIGYKRKTYIREAVISILNQTLDREKYEVIVVKSFKDKKLDSFMKKK